MIITYLFGYFKSLFLSLFIIKNMNVKEEIKVIIARRGTTLKKVCEILSQKTDKKYSYNNISNKLKHGTIKFNEVQLIFEILNYELYYKDLGAMPEL